MKKIIFLLFLALFFYINNITQAQDNDLDDFTFDDEEIEAKSDYFTMGVGITGNLLFMKYDDLNSKFLTPKNIDNFSGPMFPLGYEIFFTFIDNARIGFTYQTDSKLKELISNNEELVSIKNTAKLSNSMFGLSFSYALIPFESFAIVPSLGVNLGDMTFDNFTSPTSVEYDSKETTIYENTQINYSYLAIEPQLNLEYAITKFLMLRAGVSYVLTLDSPFVKNAWSINGNNVYLNVPDGLKPQGLNVKLGLFVGLFNY